MLLSGSNRRAYSLRISAGLDPKMQNTKRFVIQRNLKFYEFKKYNFDFRSPKKDI